MDIFVILSVGLIVEYFILTTNSLNVSCGRREDWKFMDKIGKQKLTGNSSMYFTNSSLECLQICNLKDACESFGIDMVKSECYLYDFHVWSGSRVDCNGSSLMYYWRYRDSCPVEYTYYGNLTFCYKFNTDPKSWAEAMNDCIQDGGYLTFPDTDARFDLIKSIIGSTTIYLGSTDQQFQGDWRWFNGVQVGNKWASREPDNLEGNEHCIIMKENRFADSRCSKTRAFICEIPVFN